MSRHYFGTDGVRGRVGDNPMSPDFILRLGWAAGRVLAGGNGARVLIGKDTRRSGYMFESALEAGFAAAGVEALLLGPLPTPGVAYLTRALRARAGVVISASHNPHHDNGVKFFDPTGGKLADDVEAEIEKLLDQPMQCVAPEELGRARRIEDAAGRYIEYCKSTFPLGNTLKGMKIVIDCANGAAYKVGPAVLAELGADVIPIAVDPNGFNINRECGSTHLDGLKAAVRAHGADFGVALDGDADRCLMVDAQGNELDGDDLLLIIARQRHRSGCLRGAVVGTVMSNFGLEQAITQLGVPFERAAVGDRYVLEKLRATDGILGGEASGHVLCLDVSTTGDGIVTALQVIRAMMEEGKSLSELTAGMTKLPQVLVNVRLSKQVSGLTSDPEIKKALEKTERRLEGKGRVLLRPSGTEPMIRVMVEADDDLSAQSAADGLADAVRARAVHLGAA